MPKVPDSEWVLCGSYHFFKMFLFTRDAMNWREKTWTGGTSLTCWWRCCSWIPRKGSDPARFFNIPSSPWATSQLLRLPIVRNCLPLSSRVVYWLKTWTFSSVKSCLELLSGNQGDFLPSQWSVTDHQDPSGWGRQEMTGDNADFLLSACFWSVLIRTIGMWRKKNIKWKSKANKNGTVLW